METADGVIEATGRRISIDASSWMTFDDDEARELHQYLDILTLRQQIGAMPGPGGSRHHESSDSRCRPAPRL